MQKNIGWIKVAVHNSKLVHFLQSNQQLMHEWLRLKLLKVHFFLRCQLPLQPSNSWCPNRGPTITSLANARMPCIAYRFSLLGILLIWILLRFFCLFTLVDPVKLLRFDCVFSKEELI